MRPEQVAVADLVALLLAAALTGMAVSGRLWLCRSFAVYVASALLTNRLVTWWPAHFYNYWFWASKELLQVALVIAVALELSGAAFTAFPRARRVAVACVLGVASAAAIGAGVAAGTLDYWSLVGPVGGRAALGAAWVMAALVAVAHWYRLPLAPWHRLLALGFVLHYGFYALLLGALGHFGSAAYRYVAALDQSVYAATVGLWVAGAWQLDWRATWTRARGWLRGEQYP